MLAKSLCLLELYRRTYCTLGVNRIWMFGEWRFRTPKIVGEVNSDDLLYIVYDSIPISSQQGGACTWRVVRPDGRNKGCPETNVGAPPAPTLKQQLCTQLCKFRGSVHSPRLRTPSR